MATNTSLLSTASSSATVPTNKPQFPTHHGGGNDFGGADYIAALKTSSNPKETQRKIVEWLKKEPKWLHPTNRVKGQTGFTELKGHTPLLQRISDKEIDTSFGDMSKDPKAKQYFSMADLYAAKGDGYSDTQISQWLKTEDRYKKVFKDILIFSQVITFFTYYLINNC